MEAELQIEVIIPLRNPTDVLRKTVCSLVEQTNSDFSVLISDNFSTQGQELISEGVNQLQGAGIAVRVLRPPAELGRVEHWNWAHHGAAGAWLKPLFAGDWLEPDYVARPRRAHRLILGMSKHIDLFLGEFGPQPNKQRK